MTENFQARTPTEETGKRTKETQINSKELKKRTKKMLVLKSIFF